MLSLLPRNNFRMSLFDDMDRWFDTPFFKETGRPSSMKTDIKEKDGLYLLTMDLPGFDKEDIKAELKDGYLTISANKNQSSEEKNEDGYVVRERYSGSCSRSFYVGEHVKEDNIKAAYNNGILNLSFPKEPQAQIDEPKYIAIE